MKSLRALFAVLLVLTCAGAAVATRAPLWQKIREATLHGLPQTALQSLPAVIEKAERDHAWAEAVRGVVLRVALEARIQGNKPEEKIRRLQAEIARAPQPMRPLMEAVLAEWYWQYFEQNRWRFMQRSQTTESPGDDFTAWDLHRIYAEIDAHFTRALADTAALRHTPIEAWADLLGGGNSPDAYRPTLYDFVAFEALRFYQSPEQAGARPEDAFVVHADGPALDDADAFVRWRVATTDTTSPAFRAVRLYQVLLAWHAAEGDTAALLDADLWRLDFARNAAVDADKNARAKRAWERFAERHAGHELSSRALFEWAAMVNADGDFVAAHAIAERGLGRFPGSVGSNRCFNLIHQIEARSLDVTTESVWNGSSAALDVHYRNLSAVYFRLVPWDYARNLRERLDPTAITEDDMKQLLAARPARAWSETLPGTPDYKPATAHRGVPAGLAPGPYALLYSGREDFAATENVVGASVLWVSDLALVLRGRTGGIDGLVVDAASGEPLRGVSMRLWSRTLSPALHEAAPVRSDSTGHFAWSGVTQPSIVLATLGTRQLGVEAGVWPQPPRTFWPHQQTVLFTDRAIYRPGQRIRFTGICIDVDQEHDGYHTLPLQKVTAELRDPNGKSVAQLDATTNGYGSFVGEFDAPRDRVLGAMSIQVSSGPTGSTTVRVEEYKRPKFFAELEAPRTPARLDAEVTLTGRATAYTGAPVDGAKVSWRVKRGVRYPGWWWWCYGGFGPANTGEQEIAHGTGTVGTDGRFEVRFTARPDASVPEEQEPCFTYTVTADVTEPAGETRSASRTVTVGYTTLAADIGADDWLVTGQPVTLDVGTRTLDGVPQAARGMLTVYRLRPPSRVTRGALGAGPYRGWGWGPATVLGAPADSANPLTWAQGEAVATIPFATDTVGHRKLDVTLGAGLYRAVVETRDPYGKRVTAVHPLQVVDLAATRYGQRLPEYFEVRSTSVEVGDEFVAVWGTGYERGRAWVEIEHRGKLLRAYWTDAGATQAVIRQRVAPEMRGGFSVRVTMVHDNRVYEHVENISVPWSDRRLALRWEHFVSNLRPGQHETWTAVVTGPGAVRQAAEMVATLYDASLDAYAPAWWPDGFGVFRTEYAYTPSSFSDRSAALYPQRGYWSNPTRDAWLGYREFPSGLLDGSYDQSLVPDRLVTRRADPSARRRMRVATGVSDRRDYGRLGGGAYPSSAPMAVRSMAVDKLSEAVAMKAGVAEGDVHFRGGRQADNPAFGATARQEMQEVSIPGAPARAPDLDQVVARHDLSETAFFFPQLVVDDRGEVRMEFTMPDAVTKWRFLGFAHDRDLRAGLLTGEAVTTRELMVQPNPPRFLRERDTLEFTVKVTNTSDAPQSGRVRLEFTDAVTGVIVNGVLVDGPAELPFTVPAKQSRTFAWTLHVPDGMAPLTYKAVAASASFSDGEDGALPVISRSILVTESMPMPIRGPQVRTFDFARLLASGGNDRLRSQSLTVQMVSNPAWYAVMALPYLMEFPYECSEQTFNRLYANQLARHIVGSDPKIRRIFAQWRDTPALDSPLEKNEDLKSVALRETPWVRQAESETRARHNVGVLFDGDRLDRECGSAYAKLEAMQLPDGTWPWFPGGHGNDYLTLYITTGFARLRHLGVAVPMDAALKALRRLDAWSDEMYREILRHPNPESNHLTPVIALYLYGRSFYLADEPFAPRFTASRDYWLRQARNYWLQMGARQSQAQLALALNRFGDHATATAILNSVREHAVHDDEMGMFWRDEEMSWWWYRAPIETQATLIEAFDEVAHDSVAVEDCRVWLLKQKQTQDWKTTRATADAVYALLLRGRGWLSSDTLVEVTLGTHAVKPENVEAGTGFYEERIAATDIVPAMGRVTMRKTDPGVAWGSVHWQYLADVDDVTAFTGTPLTLHKRLYVRRPSTAGPVIEPLRGAAHVGDELVVRIELRVDRDMEYVHLKDGRGSGTEPVDVLSGYRYQDGLAYYEETRDTATNFFIDYLPKGTYVFEYSVRVQHRGSYPSGIAQIQCMYAPEFNSHSESVRIVSE